MSTFRIIGRCIADPPPVDWREQLAARLGGKPRRIGPWAELGLYGALECMANTGESRLGSRARLILSSRHGPVTALRNAWEQARDDLPMPLSFIQTQPSQLLATLAAHLNWSGDGRFITSADPFALLRLAASQDNIDGLLLGWVEEWGASRSTWLRLIPIVELPEELREIGPLNEHWTQVNYLRMTPGRVPIVLDFC